jgi:putative DNA methylase
MFSRQASYVVGFLEANPFAGAAGDFLVSVTTVSKVLDRFQPVSPGVERNQDAQTAEYPAGTIISCDPPYYDNIGYADLSDFSIVG